MALARARELTHVHWHGHQIWPQNTNIYICEEHTRAYTGPLVGARACDGYVRHVRTVYCTVSIEHIQRRHAEEVAPHLFRCFSYAKPHSNHRPWG